jgi:hypothetical protein
LAVNKSLFLVPCPYHICWYNGPWRGSKKTCWREDSWILFLSDLFYCLCLSSRQHDYVCRCCCYFKINLLPYSFIYISKLGLDQPRYNYYYIYISFNCSI